MRNKKSKMSLFSETLGANKKFPRERFTTWFMSKDAGKTGEYCASEIVCGPPETETLFEVFSKKPSFRNFSTLCFNCIFCTQIVSAPRKYYMPPVALFNGYLMPFTASGYLLPVQNESR